MASSGKSHSGSLHAVYSPMPGCKYLTSFARGLPTSPPLALSTRIAGSQFVSVYEPTVHASCSYHASMPMESSDRIWSTSSTGLSRAERCRLGATRDFGFPTVVVSTEFQHLAVDSDGVVRDVRELHGAFVAEAHNYLVAGR